MREQMHKLVDDLDDDTVKPELHSAIDKLDDGSLPTALTYMRVLRGLLDNVSAAERSASK